MPSAVRLLEFEHACRRLGVLKVPSITLRQPAHIWRLCIRVE